MFVDFRHGGGVFVLVGVLNMKYFVLFVTFKKKSKRSIQCLSFVSVLAHQKREAVGV